ncbi:hypothetical protein Ddye_006155 [Dipteronia dyeriana]|uniref:Uncharacterized protein n=1 Tax=Dipteronia dyeriana TaxID=168575 RepID=A0AAE0CQD6_9ROSI|nr:hypothetical protein Ddye_006155 [Dipteronia dyeriana]
MTQVSQHHGSSFVEFCHYDSNRTCLAAITVVWLKDILIRDSFKNRRSSLGYTSILNSAVQHQTLHIVGVHVADIVSIRIWNYIEAYSSAKAEHKAAPLIVFGMADS